MGQEDVAGRGPRCSSCRFDNPPGMRFCGRCGSPLPALCSHCGTANDADAAVCRACGGALSLIEPFSAAARSADRPSVQAERRQLTVLFCDLVGSTSMSERLDPEELREVIADYQAVCSGVVRRFRGHVAQYLGDGLLVYFGYPSAHEDDARRAVECSLQILAAVRGIRDRWQRRRGIELAVRIGIHTGPVVTGAVGSGPTQERLAIGSTPNVAARLQGLAEPGSVLVSSATYDLMGDFFVCEPVGTPRLKGVSRPLEVYRVLRGKAIESRFEAVVMRGLTPMIGRRAELERLRRLLATAAAGEGQVVLISGEAGFGKSRLIHQLAHEAADLAATWWVCQGSAYYRNSALHPVIELVERIAGCSPDEPADRREKALAAFLDARGLPREEGLALLGPLLDLPPPGDDAAPVASPRERKERTLDLLVSLFVEQAGRQTLVLVVEDLHWVDPSTIEFLERLFEWTRGARVLVVATHRPHLPTPWSGRPDLHEIHLDRLTDSEAEEIVRQVGKGRALPADLVAQLAAATDGVPLFAEELTKMMAQGAGGGDDAGQRAAVGRPGAEAGALGDALAIPTSLQDLLTARLDRLGRAKEVAQLGAVIGRDFSLDLLTALCSLPTDDLAHQLSELVESELIDESATSATYSFRHALMREAAYGSLLRRERQRVHGNIASLLVDRFPARAEAQPELVAQHFTRAERYPQAIEHWRRAGERAASRWASVEASRHLQQAIDLVGRLPPSIDRDRLELRLQTELGPSLMSVKGFGAREVAVAYGRARDLCARLGDTESLFATLVGLCRYYTMAAQLDTAGEIAERLERLAAEAQRKDLLVEAHRSQGVLRFYAGRFASAQDHLHRALSLCDDLTGSPWEVYHPRVGCLAFYCLTLWALGRPEAALSAAAENLELARGIARPYDLALALSAAASVHLSACDGATTRRLAEEQKKVSLRHQLAIPLASSKILLGAAAVLEHRSPEAIRWMEEGLADWQATGALSNLSQSWFLLAEAYFRCGRLRKALAALTEAEQLIGKHRERFYEADCLRLEGNVRLALAREEGSDLAPAERSLRAAIATARRQQALMHEMRATVDLAELLAGSRRTGEAHDLLTAFRRRLPPEHEAWLVEPIAEAGRSLAAAAPT